MMDWQPIDTAPKDGSTVLCGFSANGKFSWAFRAWKTNRRLIHSAEAIAAASPVEQEWLRLRPDTYWGDPEESDDYDLALAANQPTHWLEIIAPE